jgi:hypothetical protein
LHHLTPELFLGIGLNREINFLPQGNLPISLSSTLTKISIRERSSAIVKSVGADKLAATVCPASMERF